MKELAPDPPPLPPSARPPEGSAAQDEISAAQDQASKPKKRRRWLRCLVFFLVAAIPLAFLVHEIITWPDVAALAEKNPGITAFMRLNPGFDNDAPHPWVPYAEISDHLKHAVLVAEDIDFFDHHGFAWNEIGAALRDAVSEDRRLRGASTLSQQLAKNLWLSPSRTPLRKLREAVLTVQLEHHLSKRRILELYLNAAQLGPGIFGAEAAAQRYFGKPAARLDAEESAALAAALPRPSDWYPGSQNEAYRRRTTQIRRRMERAAWLRNQL